MMQRIGLGGDSCRCVEGGKKEAESRSTDVAVRPL